MVGKASAVANIMIARFIYSIYWYYLAPALPLIRQELAVPNYELGLVPLFFIIGAGSFQIPASAIARRIGNVRTAVLGLTLLSVAGVATAFSTSFNEILTLRLLAGIGAALFFSTAATVITNLYPGKEGLMLGIYNAVFSAGAGVGLVYGVVYTIVNWRIAVLVISVIGLLESIILFKASSPLNRPIDAGLSISRSAVLVGLATAGYWGANYAAGNLLPTYAVNHGVGLANASLITSLLLFSSLVGGLSGRLADLTSRRELLIIAPAVLGSLSFLLIPTLNPYAMIASTLIVGYTSELMITASYALAVNDLNPTMGLATVNTLNMVVGMWLSPLFTALMSNSTLPWIMMIIVSVAPLPLLLVRRRVKH
ncbi:MFS transporter [Caldivirga sp. UBA161]|uniref:MFS transporter n=1 Tax=Caldivirga sp. UBA161 TaxID=1915569 RepID=UPI0025B8E2CF|nr:MFS transporter [Caldivirga sp. UBA161]